MNQVFFNLRRVRQIRGCSTALMAEYLNIEVSNYRKIENGKGCLTLERFLKICEKLDISPLDLLDSEPFIEKASFIRLERQRLEKNIQFLREEIRFLRQQNLELSASLRRLTAKKENRTYRQ